MSLQALVREDELHTRTDAERASERVLLPFHRFPGRAGDCGRPRRAAGRRGRLHRVDRLGVSWRDLCGTAWLAGIGFTRAFFISGLAFPGTGLESQARLGILLGSLVSAIIGIAILLTPRRGVEALPE
jgi:Na+/H+ antiporter 1